MKRAAPLLLLVACLLIAGCGGPSHAPKPHVREVTPPSLSGHPCTPQNYYMQCVGPQPVPRATAGPGGYGFDFAWGGPPGFTAKRGGAHFAASYLSYSSKDWTKTLLRSYRSAGIPIVFVWETSAARPLDGWNAGWSDAYNAFHEAASLGYGRGTHVDFAADFDSTYYGARFVSYYQGAAAYARKVGDTIGAYGGLHTVQTLCAYHVGTLNWQTIAWSYGRWVSPLCAPLRQTGINNHFAGYSVDNDVAVAANFGQEPAVLPKPSRAQIARWTRAREQSYGAYAARSCPKLAQREHWFDARLHGRLKEKHRRALRTTRRVYAGRQCGLFAKRVAYFQRLLSGR